MTLHSLVLAVLGLGAAIPAEAETDADALKRSVEQLRGSIGHWAVETRFLNADGSVARSVTGTYEFSWVVPDRVVSGKSEIPELKQAAGILFYINEAKKEIEMVSVGADGVLWIMTGALGDEVRISQEYTKPDGGQARLRFTRFNITDDSFESRMEVTEDGGKTWKPGNHQTFRRKDPSSR